MKIDFRGYTPFSKVPNGIDVPENILTTPIVSSGTTQFAKFVEELRLSDWLKAGHDKYQHSTNGKCPYCQQILPDNFEGMVASCFDRSYQEQIEELKECARCYKLGANEIVGCLRANNEQQFISPHMAEYIAIRKAIESKLATAFEIWDRKIKEPGATFELPDIIEDLKAINTCIAKINADIKEHNDVIDNRKEAQKKCAAMVWEQMAYDCHDLILKFQVEEKALLYEEAKANEEIKKISEKMAEIDDVIAEKSKQTVNTTGAKDSINQLIRDAGF